MRFLLFLLYKEIDPSCNSEDGKTLIKVNDTSQNLIISAKCENIKNNCFSDLKSLITFTFEDNPNLTSIGDSSFMYCSYLIIINLSACNKLTTISDSAFQSCQKVTEILLPKGLIKIGYYAFLENKLVTSIFIPSTVKYIYHSAFYFCVKLENVIFEEGSNLISLDEKLFYSTNITSFQIPENVIKFDGSVFSDVKITNITIHHKNKHF